MFPEVAKQLTLTVHIKGTSVPQKSLHDESKPTNSPVNTGKFNQASSL